MTNRSVLNPHFRVLMWNSVPLQSYKYAGLFNLEQLLAVTDRVAIKMFKLAICFLLIAVAVASAVYVPYHEAYLGGGAYGHHGPFAVSYRARVDAPRQDIVALTSVPYAYHF